MMESALWHLWWVWLAAAIALTILETLVPGFIFLGFAIGAAVMAVIVLTPVKLGFAASLAIYALLSLVCWLVLRRLFRTPDDQTRIIREDINK